MPQVKSKSREAILARGRRIERKRQQAMMLMKMARFGVSAKTSLTDTKRRKRKATPKQREASLKNLRKAWRAIGRVPTF